MKDTNNPRIDFTSLFSKQRKDAPLLVKIAFKETLELFLEDPNHPQLRNHALKNELAAYKSIDITEDWRAIFKEVKSGNRRVIVFHKIGTHKELYGSKSDK